MSKRVLIVCNSFYPHQNPRSFRATELAKEFRRRNMDVTVMCPNHDGIEEFMGSWNVSHLSLGNLTWKLPKIKGNNRFSKFINRISARLLPKLFEYPMMEFYFKVKNNIKKIRNERYDVLISIAVPYPIHWGVASVWKKNKMNNMAPVWIADCGDPYFIQQNDKYSTPFYFKWVEKWFMRKVDFITVPTPTAHEGYFPEFHPKLRVIPQGFRFEDVQTQATIEDDVIRFAYAGGFTLWRRDPSGILEYLTNLDKDLKFEFHIYTRDTHFVDRFAKVDNRIKVHGFKSRLELLRELSQYNFMLNLENFGEAQSPSKLIDYGIIEKPILSLQSFDLDLNKLKTFLTRDYSSSYRLDNIKDYRIENVVNEMICLF
jgi:hypothetical protein